MVIQKIARQKVAEFYGFYMFLIWIYYIVFMEFINIHIAGEHHPVSSGCGFLATSKHQECFFSQGTVFSFRILK